MMKLEVFDPPMCCATGICGNSVDPKLVVFASDLEWLKKQGVDVVRHGLSFEPGEFVKNENVKNLLNKEGNGCLPIVVVDNELATKACYPSREKLAEICKIAFDEEEAPPVHREENCCCGVDCDCSHTKFPEEILEGAECACAITSTEEFGTCGPECDCHKSNVSVNFKKILFVVVLLVMIGIIAAKFCCRAGAAENLYRSITSINQINPSEEASFVYIPTASNEKIGKRILSSMLSAKKTLNAKNISASLYSMSTKSVEYPQIASKTAPPAILTINKGKGKNYVTGVINPTRLLQSYIAASRDCGADCPCHKK